MESSMKKVSMYIYEDDDHNKNLIFGVAICLLRVTAALFDTVRLPWVARWSALCGKSKGAFVTSASFAIWKYRFVSNSKTSFC